MQTNESSDPETRPNHLFATTVKWHHEVQRTEMLKLLVFEVDSFAALALRPESGSIRIGRSTDCHVQLRDPTASRHHATLHFNPLRLVDEGSANGTFLDQKALARGEAIPIQAGQTFLIGRVLLVVHRGDLPIDGSCLTQASPPDGSSPRRFGGAIVRDPLTQGVFALAERVARGHINVLILGETGAGKELIAETIHASSACREGPLVRINCAALPEQLLESELFGHERGAFTGAVAAKPGVIETAHRGTIFLDEVGELTPAVQAKLLRVIETQEVQRVGAVRAKPIDVRFVSATNRDLAELVARGAFRADLFFRLNGVRLDVPPLRSRPLDVMPLALSFLNASAKRLGLKVRPRLSAATEKLLHAHTWPGNVRELRNAIDRGVLLSMNGVIEPSDLALAPVREIATGVAAPSGLPMSARTPPMGLMPPDAPAESSRATRRSQEKDRIVNALKQCCGNQTRAAKMIGMPRRTLVSKLSFFGIPRPRKIETS